MLDLRHAIRHYGARRLIALIAGLPDDSQIGRDEQPWTFRDELAALQLEQTGEWGRALALVFAGKKTTLPAPLQIQRPRAADDKKKATPEQAAAFFGRLARG